MEKTRAYLLLGFTAVLCSVLVVLLVLAVLQWRVLDKEVVPIEVTVTDTAMIGFNVGTDKLYFGTVVDGGHANREATVVAAEDAIVTIGSVGEVEGWLEVSENNFLLSAGEHKKLKLKLSPPEGTPPGNYTGTAVIEYERPFPWE